MQAVQCSRCRAFGRRRSRVPAKSPAAATALHNVNYKLAVGGGRGLHLAATIGQVRIKLFAGGGGAGGEIHPPPGVAAAIVPTVQEGDATMLL